MNELGLLYVHTFNEHLLDAELKVTSDRIFPPKKEIKNNDFVPIDFSLQ